MDTRRLPAADFWSWVDSYGSSWNLEMTELFWVMCWAIWYGRNQLCFCSNDIPYEVVISLCYKTLAEFKEANAKSCGNSEKRDPVWTRPMENWIKMNSDAGMARRGKWGIGFVGRDCAGEVVIAGNKNIQMRQSVLEAEAEALLWGLKIATECSLKLVEFESDSAQLISALTHDEEYLTEVGDILNDIRAAAMNLEGVKWRFVQRQANSLAHMIAAEAESDEGRIWMEEIQPQWMQTWNEDLLKSCLADSRFISV
ncbi:uncharacterized protein LOC126672948 [Mercurialis annua]|uniref:uncharacterized protein LOC126672948 n=1 Tax=Mercurialis annua TaxID=3986 RepID=UPI00215E7CC9|nr:uncharacterized protein LOC126672948 [Mercurialis annua]